MFSGKDISSCGRILLNRKEVFMLNKRMKISIMVGAALGVVCIIGAFLRSGFKAEAYWLFALWYNRLLMGLVIGMPWPKTVLPKAIARGAGLGLITSFAFYSATAFTDSISFLAGIVYGMIIEYLVYRAHREPI